MHDQEPGLPPPLAPPHKGRDRSAPAIRRAAHPSAGSDPDQLKCPSPPPSPTMTIKSMTGFARAEAALGGCQLALGGAQRQRPRPRRAPAAAARLRAARAGMREAVARHVAARQPHRQPVVKRATGRRNPHQRARPDAGHGGGRTRCAPTDAAPPRVEALITIKGVLDVVEPEETEDRPRHAARRCCDRSSGARRPGRRARRRRRAPRGHAHEQLDEIERLVGDRAALARRAREAVAQRLKEQVGR